MEEKTKKLIFVLVTIIIILAGVVIYFQVKEYGLRQYSAGQQEGHLVLARDQFLRQYVAILTDDNQLVQVDLNEMCGGE